MDRNAAGTALRVENALAVPVVDLKAAHEAWFPNFMAGEIGA